jgi:selenocysteine-specific elongation factor
LIVATAGHVDHGKSTLVRLLTGTDPDRWDEEKRRGLTIDLGFAFMADVGDPVSTGIAFVDVPGHQSFLPNMLAGCGAVDIGLLVVSAREGWMPQTEEHTQILDLLEVDRAVVALTHGDLVDPATLRAAGVETTARLGGTSLEGSPVIATTPDDHGSIEALRAALIGAAMQAPAGTSLDVGRPRLWIDRSFRLRGTGRVVTGTLTGGRISVGDEVVVSGSLRESTASVRGVHVNGTPAEFADPGSRVGVSLSRLEIDPVRGDAIVLPGQWTAGRRWHVSLRTVRDHPGAPAAHGGYQVFVGTAHSPAQLRYGGGAGGHTHAGPDAAVLGRLHLRDDIAPVSVGDRFVLRDAGSERTVAGGTILAVDSGAVRYDQSDLVARWRVLADSTGEPRARAGRLAATLVEQIGGAMEAEALASEVGPMGQLDTDGVERVGSYVVHPGLAAIRRDEVMAAVEASASVPTPVDPLGRIVAQQLVADGRIERLAGTLRPVGRAVDERQEAIRLITQALQSAEPPLLSPEDLQARVGPATRLRSDGVRSGAFVEVGPFLTTPDHFAQLCAAVEEAIGDGCTTVSAIRERLGLSRKYVLPLLETLDDRGITERSGNERAWVTR